MEEEEDVMAKEAVVITHTEEERKCEEMALRQGRRVLNDEESVALYPDQSARRIVRNAEDRDMMYE